MKSLGARHLAAGAVLIGVFLLFRGTMAREAGARAFELFPEMARTPARKTFGASAHLPGGSIQQPPPEGVVLFGDDREEFGPGDAEAARAGRELRNPFAADDAAALARGARVYVAFCANCHGGTGEDRTPVVDRGMIPPPSLLAARALAMADGEMHHIVTHGRGNMAPHGAQVGFDDRWRAVLHVRTLQKGAVK